jgi:hypothetical protein
MVNRKINLCPDDKTHKSVRQCAFPILQTGVNKDSKVQPTEQMTLMISLSLSLSQFSIPLSFTAAHKDNSFPSRILVILETAL